MSRPLDEQIFHAAEINFYAASVVRVVSERPGCETMRVTSIALSGLTLELHLKCLLRVRGVEYDREHDHEILFRLLPQRDRVAIRRIAEPYIPPLYEIWRAAKTASGNTALPDEPDFDSLLRFGRRVFEWFRYPHEYPIKGTGWMGGPILEGVRQVILQARPEWKIYPEALKASLENPPTSPSH